MLTLAIVAWVVAGWFWAIVASPGKPMHPPITTDSRVAARNIAERHLMGVSQTLPVAEARFRLLGGMTASAGKPGFAIVVEEGKKPMPAIEGEEFLPGIVLTKVLPNQVRISQSGHEMTLTLTGSLDNSASVTQGAATPAIPPPAADLP